MVKDPEFYTFLELNRTLAPTLLMNESERLLIQGLVDNQLPIIRKILDQVMPKVQRYLMKQGCAEKDAEDISCRALELLLIKARCPNFVLSSKLSTYLNGIAYNLWLKQHRKQQKVSYPDELPETPEFQEIALLSERQEKRDLIRKYVKQLSAECQKLIALFYQSLPMVEIAQQFNLKNATAARVKKRRCIIRLEKLIRKDPAYNELGNG